MTKLRLRHTHAVWTKSELCSTCTWEKNAMKVKTSIVLSDEILQEMQPYLSHYHNRSELIECALRTFLTQLAKHANDTRELQLLNQYADELNEEALDVLDYQVSL